MKKVWILNHYATNGFRNHGGRHYNFAKYLIDSGCEVKVFCASTVHNTNIQHHLKGKPFVEEKCDKVEYVFIRTRDYIKNGRQRVMNMLDYYFGILSTAKLFEQPDIIIGSSVHPLACVAAIKLAKRFKIPAICEIRDLWPESIVAYDMKSRRSPFIRMLYRLEKWIYTKADAIIFTMEGGKDYIIEKGWDKAHGGPIDLRKVYHINNGVDLESFHQNLYENAYHDKDLDDEASFKVVYTGSVRRANNIDLVIDTAKQILDTRIKFLIYGGGSELERLKQRCWDEQVNNVVFKGAIEKKYIPSILSRSDLNFFVLEDSNLFRFGLSLNKSFEYLASGKPLLIIGCAAYSMVDKYGCGLHVQATDAREFADAVMRIKDQSRDAYLTMCDNARKAANDYDFKVLAKKLIKVIEKTAEDKQAIDEGVNND